MAETLKIVSWNINSVRIRLGVIEEMLAQMQPDIFCLQELKCQEEHFPHEKIAGLGFEHQYIRGQKSYNGVGIFSKTPLLDVEMLEFGGNDQARHISAKLPNGARLHNFYIPAGGDEADPEVNPSFAHKLQFVDDMVEYFKSKKDSHIILGDFNIAPYEHDVWSHKQLLKVVSHTPIELEKLGTLRDGLGWVDAARKFVPLDEKSYSWWSYRNRDWEKSNRGRRLDHIWVTPELDEKLVSYEVLRHARNWDKPSDHVPILVEIKA